MQYRAFIFEGYRYHPATSMLSLFYRYSDGPQFEEKLIFDIEPRRLTPAESEVLDQIFRLIFLMSGVSYYKAYVPKLLICEPFALGNATVDFLAGFYENGLAEFAFRNGLSLSDHCRFQPTTTDVAASIAVDLPHRTCVPVGGGKDSIVTIESLRKNGHPLLLFALGDAEPITACVAAAQLPFIRVRRQLDDRLFELNKAGALNGHVPITGILSAIALAAAVMAGCNAVVMSNEHSASDPNFTVDGRPVNHQYSKSFEFEQAFADYIERFVSPGISYFSLLRPFSEIEIARRFAKFPTYFGKFRSCNTAFRQLPAARGRRWCGDCAKCRFVFLALAPFVSKSELVEIFGHNLLDDQTQRDGFAELCGLEQHKPFECVGEVAESATVMSYLGGHPDWWQDAVVRQLNDEFPALRHTGPAQFRTLLEIRHPHRVPPSYTAMLDACG